MGVQAVDNGHLGRRYDRRDREVDGFERYLGVVKKKSMMTDWIWVSEDRSVSRLDFLSI